MAQEVVSGAVVMCTFGLASSTRKMPALDNTSKLMRGCRSAISITFAGQITTVEP